MKEIRGLKLINHVTNSLPQVIDTRLTNHCTKVVPVNKGRAARFKWKQRDFMVSSRLKVKEYMFGIHSTMMEENAECADIEIRLKKNIS